VIWSWHVITALAGIWDGGRNLPLPVRHECCCLEYAENQTVICPLKILNLLSRYGHDEGLLDKLWGRCVANPKGKLKDANREMAEQADPHRRRNVRCAKAPVMDPPPGHVG